MDDFTARVWGYYHEHARTMPWRDAPTFYNVLVSEMMLQQTQVSRVVPKFMAFIEQFPTVLALAKAPQADVTKQWVGLGYNRRAKYLHDASKLIVQNGQPDNLDNLVKLPGIGKNTAAAIMNYVYNVPTPFIETNVRTVYTNYFFAGQMNITDSQIMELVVATIDRNNPREWFWALMDYGAHQKAEGNANLNASKHYKKQSALKGSVRQMRGWIITELASADTTATAMQSKFGDDWRYERALEALKKDGLISETHGILHLTK